MPSADLEIHPGEMEPEEYDLVGTATRVRPPLNSISNCSGSQSLDSALHFVLHHGWIYASTPPFGSARCQRVRMRLSVVSTWIRSSIQALRGWRVQCQLWHHFHAGTSLTPCPRVPRHVWSTDNFKELFMANPALIPQLPLCNASRYRLIVLHSCRR